MASADHDYGNQKQKLLYNREQFDDYWTALLARVRQHDDCEDMYTGATHHPILALQSDHSAEIKAYGIPLIPLQVLGSDPLGAASELIRKIEQAARRAEKDPPLGTNKELWDKVLKDWSTFKKVQRKIYAIIVSTLEIGSSISYARDVPYGCGTMLINNIYHDNRRHTTRALFTLFTNLFSLKLKEH